MANDSPLQQRLTSPVRVIIGSVTIAVLVLSLIGYFTRQDYLEVDSRISALARRDAVVASIYFTHSLHDIENLMQQVADLRATPRIGPEMAARLIESHGSAFPSFLALLAYDGSDVTQGLGSGPAINELRAWAAKNPASGDNMTIGKPIAINAGRPQVIPLVKRVRSQVDGRTSTLVVALSTNFIGRVFTSLGLSDDSMLVMVNQERVIVGRAPYLETAIGLQIASSSPLVTQPGGLGKSGPITAKSPSDGVIRRIGASNSDVYPMAAVVGLAESASFALWRTRATRNAVIAGVLLLIIGILGKSSLDRARLQSALQTELQKGNDEAGRMNRELEEKVEVRTLKLQESTRQLEGLLESLEAKSMAQQRMIHILSHDLREPLNAIINFASILGETQASTLTPDGVRHLGFISRSGTRMKSLLDDLLKYVRLEGGELEQTDIVLDELLQEVVADLDTVIKARQALVTWTLPCTVKGDRSLLRLVFQNLVSNALKFVPPDTVPRVQLTCAETGPSLVVRVQDNGIGIPENQVDEVFTLFHRLHSQKAYQGAGLGLATVRRIVEMHGGSIKATSVSGSGTCFVIEMPNGRPPFLWKEPA